MDQDIGLVFVSAKRTVHTPGVSCCVKVTVFRTVMGFAPWPASWVGLTLKLRGPPSAVNWRLYVSATGTTKATACEQLCGPAGRTPENANGACGGNDRA
jgi:hypothetical protein